MKKKLRSDNYLFINLKTEQVAFVYVCIYKDKREIQTKIASVLYFFLEKIVSILLIFDNFIIETSRNDADEFVCIHHRCVNGHFLSTIIVMGVYLD